MMSNAESLQRLKHADLPTKQRRLRHLRSIAARNLGMKDCRADVGQIETYFTLHTAERNTAFYTSEKILGSLNPTWRTFNLAQLTEADDTLNTASGTFVVKVWRGSGAEFVLIIVWQVSLTGLVFLGDKLQREEAQYPPDSLIFGMFDGFYGTPRDTARRVWDPHTCRLQVDQSTVKISYSCQTLSRIQTILRAIKQTQSSVQRVKCSIEDRLSQTRVPQKKKSRRELGELKVNLMRGDLEWRTMKLQTFKEAYETIQQQNYRRKMALTSKYETLMTDKSRLHEKKKSYFDVREELIKTGAQLVMRRKQLISELAFIYPITQHGTSEFAICSVKLPNSEDFSGQDETMIAVGLGYTCHLVLMISEFLEVPLRYPVEHRGSRSLIKDHIIDKLSDKERDFPLYSKGKERFQFNYGVYLLNKNIAQLRYYCGLGTTDLRLTLTNLKSLLELRLGVKFDATNTPILAAQHLSIPPNLGGPQKSASPFFTSLQYKASQVPNNPVLVEPTGQQTDASLPQDSNAEKHSQDNPYLYSPKAGQVPAEVIDVVIASPEVDAESHSSSSAHHHNARPDGQSPEVGLSGEGDEMFKRSSDSFFVIQAPSSAAQGLTDDDVPDTAAPHRVQSEVHVHAELKKDLDLEEGQNGKIASGSVQDKLPPMRTLEDLTKEKLLSSIANYDDMDVSSSEDSYSSATYNSKFKLWPRDQSLVQPAHGELHCSGDYSSSKESSRKLTDPSSTEEEDLTSTVYIKEHCSQDIAFDTVDSLPSFKTKAMYTTTDKDGSIEYDELATDSLEILDSNDFRAVREVNNCSKSQSVCAPPRERLGSEHSEDESATFVIGEIRTRSVAQSAGLIGQGSCGSEAAKGADFPPSTHVVEQLSQPVSSHEGNS